MFIHMYSMHRRVPRGQNPRRHPVVALEDAVLVLSLCVYIYIYICILFYFVFFVINVYVLCMFRYLRLCPRRHRARRHRST